MEVSASSTVAFDFDQDGDDDLLIAGRQVPGRYPLPARSYLLRNDSQGASLHFADVSAQAGQAFFMPGMVCDVVSTDLNGDSYPDLVMVGEWMPIRMFLNDEGKGFLPYATAQLSQTAGWWNCLAAADLDGDGDTDFILGNEGLNSFYSASPTRPISLVGKDFNGDGTFDPVMGHYLGEKLYPVPPRDALNQQIIQFRKKYQNYGQYAKATYNDLFSEDELKDAFRAEAFTLQSTLLFNEGKGKFTLTPLPKVSQQSPIFGIVPFDYDQDGNMDVVLSGNFFPNEVHMGRQDASRGLLLLGDGKGNFTTASAARSGLNLKGDARSSHLLRTTGGILLLTALNSRGIAINRLVNSYRKAGNATQ